MRRMTETRFVVGLLLLPCLAAAGCRNESPSPMVPDSARIAPAPNVTPAPSVAPAPSAAAASIEADASSEKPAASEDAPAIACKTTDDCWVDDQYKPIARPAKLRGKKIVPCKGSNGEHTPDCKEGKCVVVGWKC